jgi:hypothetical protein
MIFPLPFASFSYFTPYFQESYFRSGIIAGPSGLDSCMYSGSIAEALKVTYQLLMLLVLDLTTRLVYFLASGCSVFFYLYFAHASANSNKIVACASSFNLFSLSFPYLCKFQHCGSCYFFLCGNHFTVRNTLHTFLQTPNSKKQLIGFSFMVLILCFQVYVNNPYNRL